MTVHGARGGREPDGSGGGCGVYENRAAQFPNGRGRAARISGSSSHDRTAILTVHAAAGRGMAAGPPRALAGPSAQ